MNIKLYPIVSSLHEGNVINSETEKLLNNIKAKTNWNIQISDLNHLYESDITLILVQSGGSEGEFLKVMDQLQEPFYFLTYGSNNSLAASLEILSYLKDRNIESEVLHGSEEYIIERIKKLSSLRYDNLGVIGKPSDWLIASSVNYEEVRKIHNINLIDIDINELVDEYKQILITDIDTKYDFKYNEKELVEAKKVYLALKRIVNKYDLSGLTIRCFDLLNKIHTTSCLGLALLNAEGITATCEGDIPSMISMYLLKKITNQSSFQANPSRIDVDKSEMVLAHCTLPLDIVSSYKLDSHYESKIGIGIKGELKLGKVTIFKLSRDLIHYYVTTGEIIDNLNEKELCRSQIKVHIDSNIEYFLTRPYGNHHIIIYGDYATQINKYMKKIVVE